MKGENIKRREEIKVLNNHALTDNFVGFNAVHAGDFDTVTGYHDGATIVFAEARTNIGPEGSIPVST